MAWTLGMSQTREAFMDHRLNVLANEFSSMTSEEDLMIWLVEFDYIFGHSFIYQLK